MYFRVIDIPKERQAEILPAEVCRIIVRTPYIIVAGIEDGVEQAILVMIEKMHMSNMDHAEAEIIYLYSLESDSQKRLEICVELVKRSCELAFRTGIESIAFTWIESEGYLMDVAKTMKKSGFMPVRLTGMVMVYGLEDILEQNAYYERAKELWLREQNTFTVFEQDDKQLEAIFDAYREYDLQLDTQLYDSRYSRFYIEDNEVKGFVIGVMPNEHTLYIPAFYGRDFHKSYGKCILMLIEIIEEATKSMPELDEIWFQSYNLKYESGLLNFLDIPKREMQIHEYIRVQQR